MIEHSLPSVSVSVTIPLLYHVVDPLCEQKFARTIGLFLLFFPLAPVAEKMPDVKPVVSGSKRKVDSEVIDLSSDDEDGVALVSNIEEQ